MSALSTRSGAPLSVAEISRQASNFEYNAHIPLRYWLRSVDTILKEAHIYEHEGNDSQTYLLLLRHAILALEKLPQHPDAKEPGNQKALREIQKIVNENITRMEILKPRIDKRYARFQEDQRRRSELVKQQELRRSEKQDIDGAAQDLSRLSLESKRLSDTTYSSKRALEASEHKDLATRLAQREIRRRDGQRRYVRQAGVSAQEEQEKRMGGQWGDWDHDQVQNHRVAESKTLSDQIVEAGRRQSGFQNGSTGAPTGLKPSNTIYKYPTVPPKSRQEESPNPDISSPFDHRPTEHLPPPPRTSSKVVPRPPPIPPKPEQVQHQETRPPPVPAKYIELEAPISRSATATSESSEVRPQDYTFNPTAFLENGSPLRPVFLPTKLRSRFLSIAAENTRKNLETCGLLCGTLISNALFISKLVIPEQKSTSDTCETQNEEALFDFCDEENLMILGWIHTHPTQTCFMSSRDLHTHSGYQVMIPESVAIVCAPSKTPSWGAFRLTDPPGLKTILECNKPGLFHPHDSSNTYTDAIKPGHVVELSDLDFDVKDLRPGYS